MRRTLVELFVRRSQRHDEAVVEQTVRTVLFGLALIVWVPVFTPLYFVVGARWAALTVAIAGPVCLLLIFSIRLGASAKIVAQLICGLLFTVLCVVSLFTGGIAAPALTWLCAVPILGVLLGGRWPGIVWMLLAIAAAVGFFAANQAGMSFETEATPVGQQWLYVACLCGIIICVSVLTGIFRQSEQQSRDEADRARRVADTANRAKGDFLAKMSHEIRTPMNGVLGMTQLALTTELTDEQRDYIEAARESAEGLLVVVNDILDFSRLEAGRLELRPQGFRVRDLIRRTMTLLAVRADADLVNVTWSVDEAVPEVVIADMGRIRQVLINLVGNAIKFTPQGTVTTFVEMVDAPPATDGREQAVSLAEPPTSPSGQLPTDQQLLAVTVSDTGVGIAEDQQAKIFEEFEQADGSIARMFGGTGLGLAITRGLVTLMNGQVTLESQVDVGSTFRFVIPVALGTPEDLPADDSSFTEPDQQRVERIDGLRILVIDDNRTNQILIRGLLQKQGCDVTIADSGEAALELFQEVEFDLAFMDIEMPGMDGFETTRRIRMLEVDESRLPIFALTAHALPNYGLRCLAAGMDGYLSKPLKMHEVFAILERVAITRDQTGQTT